MTRAQASSIDDKIADIHDLATAYCHALDAAEGADSQGFAEAQMKVAVRLHDLRLAVRGDCRICDTDTCPGFLS